MRGVRSTIALLVVFVGLAAYIYFVTWKTTDTDAGSKLERVFASLEVDKIDEIKVKAASGETTTVKKVNGTWQIVAPLTDNVDESEVSGITSGLVSVEVSRALDENPADLKEYGLASPRIEIEFKAGGEKDYRKLIIGEKSPTGAQLFAKRNDEERVFLIPAFQEGTFNRTTFDLRDKRLLKFDPEKVDGLEVTAGARTLQIQKDGSDWKITRPVQAKADYGSVAGLVGRLQSTNMKTIVANDVPPADLRKYGLDKPPVTVNVNAGNSRATLLVGGRADDSTFYARDGSKPAVFTIDSALADDLKKGADDYRRKDLFELRPYNTNRLELTRNGQPIVLEQAKTTDDNALPKWRRVSPNPADLERDKIEPFVTKLANLRAASFADSIVMTGLDNPVLTVHAKFDENKEERVTFGKVGNDAYASHPGQPGVAKVDTTEFDEVIKALDEVAK